MAGDEDDAIADQFAGERHSLIRVAEVVTHDELDALAEDAAPGIEVVDRQLDGALIALAGPGVVAGHRAGRGNPDLGAPRTSRKGSRPK